MPISYRMEPHESLVLARFHGEITVDQLRDYNRALRGDPAFHSGIRELVELDRIQPAMDYSQLVGYREWFNGLAPIGATAIVAADSLAIGMARQFQSLAETGKTRIQVFHDEPAARAWLRGLAEEAGD